MPAHDVIFGFGAHSNVDDGPELLRMVQQADRDGLDLFSLSDHPYLGRRLDAYATIAFLLGQTRHIAGLANVTNLPTRPAPMLARTVTSLSALTGGRVVLGMGAGGLWDRISDMGVPRLSPGDAVDAFEEAIILIRKLSGGGPPITHQGRHYQVRRIEPAPVAAPPVWTGSNGPKSLAATGRVADGWLPGHAADWRSERYRTSRPIIDEAAVAAGRDPREIRTIYNFPGRITDRPLPATRDRDDRWIGGSVGQWIEELTEAVLEHQASGFILFSADHGAVDPTTLARWSREIVPAVREAIAKETP
ncbi:similar to Coenzyme F420-dependent N5 N10-methylene tetrahydromethanopterin reductase and related flavin-dependent oxidoreductases [[Actinomadura] parvosata subsp. kistnae]|uniref:5,10-methylene tetrahydromethanopterin reductase n=1 Tax=[Actinomadura] parvosata subsp. kistnae TaxID=1909395 RepID=A0A1V0AA63_9ACTN|nr:LLM class flavin-dependent oxidoreductase [Nonomuraea sp. ATCC 55076]AQZ67087.1 5,10-methylene tetrahydromethanopterin reductase [Nonomuraea sp. ATCC 55076]SPL94723.1 similar to Coenzyme F420-dependent N5 N10-methylene tetrahydromethanopterin reductase and related flavin-dependent oxidoreductases [Actinomadura parvosata subsp. kistnae]